MILLINILIVIALVLLILTLWMLIAPIRLTIDSVDEVFELRWVSIGQARVVLTDDLIIHIEVLFWKKDWMPLENPPQKRKSEKERGPKESKPKKPKTSNWKFIKRKGRNILRSFQVKYFRWNLDTGNFMWNSFLLPISLFFDRGRNRMTINYMGKNEFRLIVENRPIRVLWALIT